MRRRFISKSKKSFPFVLKIFLFLIIGIFVLSKILSIKIFNKNSNFVTYIMEQSNHLIDTDLSYFDKLTDISNLILNIDIKNPVSLLTTNIIYKENIEVPVSDNYSPLSVLKNMMDNFKNINVPVANLKTTEPSIYIYNTHQQEEYVNTLDAVYSMTPTVYTAANLLKNSLEEKNIKAIVEEGNITEYLSNNGLNYDDSYIASRYYLTKAIERYPNIKLFIDLHRDALSHDAATVQYDGKNYAKVLFVVGLDHNSYQSNLDLANELNNSILEKYSFLTRGVMEKSGPLVNGVYNQDLKQNIILLEIGGNESTIDEVSNTIELISEIIYKKIGDENV